MLKQRISFQMWNAVATRKVSKVDDAKSLVKAATHVCKLSTNIIFLPKEEINNGYPSFNLEDATAIPGISKIHCVEPKNNGTVVLRKYSSQVQGFVVHQIHDPTVSSDDDDDGDGAGDDGDGDGEIAQEFSKATVPFMFPHYLQMLVEAVLSSDVQFRGSSLTNLQDLKQLSGKEIKPKPGHTDNWLSNFVIGEYLKLISCQASSRVKAIPWEKFERSSDKNIAAELEGSTDSSFKEYDCILISCNPRRSQHWFLLAMFPKLRLAVALDSTAGGHIKPAIKVAMEKCKRVESLVASSEEWNYYTNSDEDVPQQDSGYDCGVFLCLHAWALVLGDPLLLASEIPDFSQMMILDLHQQLESYYVVDYVTKFYIGRLLRAQDWVLTFKFLYTSQCTGLTVFDWPRRDDVEIASV